MRKMIPSIFALSLLLTGCFVPPKPDLAAFRAHPPRSIVVVPVANDTPEITAPAVFAPSLTIPLAERGYYVFPIYLTEILLRDLGRETTGGIWLLGKQKTQRARARVVLRLVDPKTGELFYTQEGSGDATISSSATLGFGGTTGFDSTLEGKAIDAAIVNLMNNVVKTLDARRSSLK